MLNALIIGGDSQVGRELHLRLIVSGKSVIATSRRWPQCNQSGFLPFDMEYPSYLPKAEYTFLCAGINGFKKCAADEETARRINVKAVGDVACRLSAMGSNIIYLSSSVAETHPETVYGKCKLDAEKMILALGGVCLRFGPVAFPGKDVWPNDTYSPINVPTLMDLLMSCMNEYRAGLYCVYNRKWVKEAA